MDDTTLDAALRRSAPPSHADHPAVEAGVHALVADAETASRPSRRRRRALWIAAVPVVPALALALTAGIEERLAPDLTIPVSYTTDTGTEIQCSIWRFNGEINWVETSFVGVDHLRDQDWSGIGQRIYERALKQEAELSRLVRVDPDSPVVALDDGVVPDAAMIQSMAWSIAEGELIDDTVPARDGDHWGGDSDCEGLLH